MQLLKGGRISAASNTYSILPHNFLGLFKFCIFCLGLLGFEWQVKNILWMSAILIIGEYLEIQGMYSQNLIKIVLTKVVKTMIFLDNFFRLS